ncbi:hypothetical protein jhhlp_003946 [Lomentospora prolificans]|uniref:Xylanolytic transcriptional activator regulatory domain-containing protein n=1 Tax=Lomentospora prolificans TaxID=41688 RepID=A0A2N3NAC3_9PEZI|nr:hypothetical protein jhhlp_003946 [Lomentospora prolificans]
MDDGHDGPVEANGADESFDGPQGSSGPIRRACDACRARKVISFQSFSLEFIISSLLEYAKKLSHQIRCNRESPCSHCLQAKIQCTHADNKPREKRTRILITPQYERKIDLIDRRLDGVIRLLEDLKMNWQPGPPQAAQDKATPPKATSSMSTPGSGPSHTEATGPVVEGDSSLTAHSAFANQFFQEVISTDELQDSSLEMRETLDALHHIVHSLKHQTASSEMSYPNARPSNRVAMPPYDLPPIRKSVEVIQAAKAYHSPTISVYETLCLPAFSELCLRVYFSQDFSEADFITTSVGLYYLFFHYAYQAPESSREEYLSYANMCRDNTETALSNLPLHLPATYEMILALALGTFYTIEMSKPSLCWTLCSKASELCQTLGYHRAASMKNDSPEEASRKQALFWGVYMADKGLSLRMGRASSIQDWDITIPLPKPERSQGPLWHYFTLWVLCARVQGRIYELLYSPESVTQPDHVRKSRVETLTRELELVNIKTEEANIIWVQENEKTIGSQLLLFLSTSDDVLRLSLLTLVHRAAPREKASPTTFTQDCIKAARETLARHQDCMNVLEGANSTLFSIYIHWTLLYAPFIPFIVIFCHVIETQDREDLARLHAFNASMQSAPTVSEAAGKVYRLFQVLYSVALRYVEFRTSTPQPDQMEASAQMDAYLSALGFPSSAPGEPVQASNFIAQPFGPGGVPGGGLGPGPVDAARTGSPMAWLGNGAAQLDDWLYSNSQMIGMLQEPGFNFPNQNENP